MIKQTLKTISKPDKDIAVFAKEYNKLAYEAGQSAFGAIREPLLDELKFYPPELPNQQYVRTYRLRRGWKAGIRRIKGNTYSLVISNDTEYAAMVVGSLAQAVSAAARFQHAIHQGRWPLAANTVKFWQDVYLEEIDKAFTDLMKPFGRVVNTRRAFTSSTVGLS